MPEAQYDALVIGGGPGGSAAATFLARANRRVLVLEKEHFPRFHIGESLLPYNRKLFEEMGVLPALEAAGFPVKFGAQFHVGNASKCLKLVFRRGRFTRLTTAFQVERAKFDDLLLKHAGASGAEVREGWMVTNFSRQKDAVQVQARDDRGQSQTFQASFLVDASGRGNFTGNQEGLRVLHPKHKKVAIFSQFQGVVLDEGPEASDTIIVRLDNEWFWIIPLGPEKVSVGCVLEQEEFTKAKQTPQEIFDRICQSSAAMRARMQNARMLAPMQTTSDFSYYNRRLAGPRLLRVGDAAGFMDPIFSAGVFLAMYSGRLAANAVLESLAAGDEGAARFRRYEKTVFRAMKLYWRMVEEFYTKSFIELFLEPNPNFNLPDTITALLAGETEGGWPLAWRRRLFFLLTRIQRYWPLVPRISFDPEVVQECKVTGSAEQMGADVAGEEAQRV